jgi:hypothetical protein
MREKKKVGRKLLAVEAVISRPKSKFEEEGRETMQE